MWGRENVLVLDGTLAIMTGGLNYVASLLGITQRKSTRITVLYYFISETAKMSQ
jgi:hypothetical protein